MKRLEVLELGGIGTCFFRVCGDTLAQLCAHVFRRVRNEPIILRPRRFFALNGSATAVEISAYKPCSVVAAFRALRDVLPIAHRRDGARGRVLTRELRFGLLPPRMRLRAVAFDA